jgi:aldehyde:ferredoxin oxidoreductase
MNPPASSEIPYPKIASRSSIDGKAELAKLTEDWWAFTAAAGWCNFARFGYGSESTYLRVYAAVTGVELKISEALLIGERIFNLKRCFNFRHGCTKGEDTLPQRLLTEPGNAGNVVRLNEMLKEYYNLRGWDLQTGIPTQDKLSALDLSDLIDKLRLRG